MSKFKFGDRVRVVEIGETEHDKEYYEVFQKYIDEEGIVVGINEEDDYPVEVQFNQARIMKEKLPYLVVGFLESDLRFVDEYTDERIIREMNSLDSADTYGFTLKNGNKPLVLNITINMTVNESKNPREIAEEIVKEIKDGFKGVNK